MPPLLDINTKQFVSPCIACFTYVYAQIFTGHIFCKGSIGEDFHEALFCLRILRTMWVTTVAITQQPEKYLCIY